MILLVVDTQRGCFTEKLYAFETVKENIKLLIAEARKNGIEVCYVQHDDGPGADLDKETPNYEIFDEFAPLPDEKRFEKNVNSAFHPMTGLSEYLKSKNEMEIITIGVSTDYCMDATVKCGFEQGFKIIIPAYANSTFDNPYFDKETAYKYFNEFMWPKRYAKAVSVDEAIEMMKNLSDYLKETDSIDYTNPLVAKKAAELKAASSDKLDYIEKAYKFVRDEIPHTWDARLTVVSKSASDVLKNKTGICWTKSCLLAALLRANKIPAGISYQRLTRADDASDGYIIHALNTVYIDSLKKWIRLDARGNKPGVDAQFSLEKEILAFPARIEFGEKDYRDNHSDLDVRLKEILKTSGNIFEVRADFEM